MKNLNFTFKSIVQGKARWLLTILAIFTLGIGQMWGYAITVYVIPKAIWGNDWTEGSSKVKMWWKFGSTSTAEYMSKTVWTYNGDCVYAYTVYDLSSDGLDYLTFQRFSSAGVHQVNHDVYSSWKEASNFGGKIFKGEWSGGNPVWHTFGRDITIYGVPENMNAGTWNEGSHTLYANFKVGDDEWKKQLMTKTSDTYAGNPIYKCTMLIKYNVIKIVQFLYNDGSDHNLYDYTPGSQHSTDDIDGKIFRGYIGSTHKWSTYEVDHSIAAGSTIVWDLGENDQSWSDVYLYKTVNSTSADPAATNDAFTQLGSSTQHSKTYNSAVNYIGAWLFRKHTSNWDAHTQTTNIDRNVSGLTLYTYCDSETSDKLNWQVATDGKKGSSGRTIYFDDTYTSWKNHEAENREIYFNYGVDWDGGGYHRKIDFEVEKVPGTANLYKLKASSEDATNTGATNSGGQFDHDIYFQKWYVSKYYGYTNHNPITDSHVLERTEIYTDAITSNDFTLIPTTKKSGGSGTDGSPYVWNTTKKTGHTWNVSINAPSHGTITVGYTNESGSSASLTSGNADVAHTCILTITAAAAYGYDDPETVSINSGTLANEGNYTIRENITVSATFSPHRYSITLNAGDHGEEAGSASVDFDATGLYSVTHVSPNAGYILEGYYDGSTKVLNANGEFAGTNIAGYITSGKWSKYDEDATLTAKFTPITFAVRFNANGGSGTMANQDFTYEVSQNLTANAFTKAGYYFEGWAETADGSVAVSDGADGSTLCTTNEGTKNLYAVWTAATTKAASCWDGDTWKGPASGFDTPKPTSTSLSWSTATWSKGTGEEKMPTIESQVVIPASTTMTIAEGVTATAKEIVLGSGAKLDVAAGGALILGGSVNVGGSATSASNLTLSSDGTNGSAALISSVENTGTVATVEFYTKATYNSAAAVGAQYVNQYFGIPFDEVEADIYDESEYVYEFKVNENKWEPVNIYGTMTAFTAYNLLRTSTSAEAISKSGTLNLPGTTTHKDKVLTLTRRASDVSASKTTTNMFANSWTAPINIASMVTEVDEEKTTPEFVGVEPTIYIFNAGTYADKDRDGQWISLPVKSVYDNPGSYALKVIPSQQAFLVYATGEVEDTHTLTLDYNKHVYAPAKAAADAGDPIGIAPAKAPKRTTATNNDFMAVNVSGESGYSDRVMIFMDGKFSEGFDNGWDGRKLSGKGYTPQLYALTSDGKMAVNSVPTVEGTVLGFKRGSQDTNYTISFEYDGDEEWYLNDTEEQISTLINEENSYEFTTSSDDDVARFVISATPIKKITTGTNTVSDGVNARKLMIDGQLYIIRDGRIYNAEGALMK